MRVRRLLPRKNTAFRVTNRSARPRDVALVSGARRIAGTATPLRPGESVVMQALLESPRYELVVSGVPGAIIETYVPR